MANSTKAIDVGVALTKTVLSEKMKTVSPNGELIVAEIAREWKPSLRHSEERAPLEWQLDELKKMVG